MCLDFESTGLLHCACPQTEERLSGRSFSRMRPNWILIWKMYLQAPDQKKRKLVIARDVKLHETLLGFGKFRNNAGALHIYDDEKKVAPTDDIKILLARNLHSSKEKKCKLCRGENRLHAKKMPGRKKKPRKMINFFLIWKHTPILNFLENLVKYLKEF